MVFKLPLAPPETLGRRFQYALLSLRPELAEVDSVSGYAIFNNASDYLDLLGTALESIGRMTVGATRRARGYQEKNVRGIDCHSLHRGPQLYAVGKVGRVEGQSLVGDYLILAQAGFTECPYTTAAGKATVAWTHAAVSYADKVLTQGSPLGGVAPELPWLAKATIFGKPRTAGGGQLVKVAKPTLDTLGSVLLGGAISFLWGQRVGESVIEFYLVPDIVHEGFAILRETMLAKGMGAGSIARAAKLANNYPVSLEVALAITLAEDIADRYGPASQMSAYRTAVSLEKAASIATVTPQKRPMVRSVIPLSLAIYVAYSNRTLKAISFAIGIATRLVRQKEFAGLRDLIGRCINSMYLQATSCRWSDHLSACIRDLYSVADQAERRGQAKIAAALESLASSLSKDYLELLEKC